MRIVRLFRAMPRTTEAQVIGKQLLRSGTSVGAQYRVSQFAKSDADLISKIVGSLQELEETIYWLELVIQMEIFDAGKIEPLVAESNELKAILITIFKKIKNRKRKSMFAPFSFFRFPLFFVLAPGSAQGLWCELR